MNARPFIFAVVAVVILGITLGGAFIAGVALGRTQAEPEPQMSFLQAPSAQGDLAAGGAGGEMSQAQIQELRQRAQSGEITPEQIQQIRAQTQAGGGASGGATVVSGEAQTDQTQAPSGGTGQSGPPAGLGQLGAGGRTIGTVKSIDDGVLTVETFQGTVQVNIDEDTTLQGLTKVSLSDVEVDSMAVLVGERTESGEFDASSVIVLPEGVLPGAGGFRRAGAGIGAGGGGQ